MSTKPASAAQPDPGSVGDIIRTARHGAALSKRRLAERIGVSKGSIYDLETNRYKQPSADLLLKVAQALEIDEQQLLGAAGYPYPMKLPDLPVYLRTKFELSDEALAHMKTQWEFVCAHYGVSPKNAEQRKPDSK